MNTRSAVREPRVTTALKTTPTGAARAGQRAIDRATPASATPSPGPVPADPAAIVSATSSAPSPRVGSERAIVEPDATHAPRARRRAGGSTLQLTPTNSANVGVSPASPVPSLDPHAALVGSSTDRTAPRVGASRGAAVQKAAPILAPPSALEVIPSTPLTAALFKPATGRTTPPSVGPVVESPVAKHAPQSIGLTPSGDPDLEAAAVEDTQATSLPPSPPGPGLDWQVADARVLLLASVLDDLEAARIAASNRLRSFVQVAGISPLTPEIAVLQQLVDETAAVEDKVAGQLQRAMKQHPLGPLVNRTKGLGLRQAARLLSVIGCPAWHPVALRPRRLGELRAYCGYHVHTIDGSDAGGFTPGDDHSPAAVGIAPRRRRGQRSNWNDAARTRLHLIAATSLKFRCPACTAASRLAATDDEGARWTPPPPECACETKGYRLRMVYDAGRAKYADAVHSAPCGRCGPAGSPAAVGSPLSAAHQHGRAVRLVAKYVLRQLWQESRALCGFADDPTPPITSE